MSLKEIKQDEKNPPAETAGSIVYKKIVEKFLPKTQTPEEPNGQSQPPEENNQ